MSQEKNIEWTPEIGVSVSVCQEIRSNPNECHRSGTDAVQQKTQKGHQVLIARSTQGDDSLWFVSFHYRDNHTDEQKLILDVQDFEAKAQKTDLLQTRQKHQGIRSIPLSKTLVLPRAESPGHRSIPYAPDSGEAAREPKYTGRGGNPV